MDKLKVAVIGDCILDVRRYGFSTRVSPEDPNCKVLEDVAMVYELGGAANVANWLAARDELEVTLFGHYALDDEGVRLSSLCRERNIILDDAFCRQRGEQWTTRKERICIQKDDGTVVQQLVRCDRDSVATLSEKEYCYLMHHYNGLGYFDMIVVADYDKGVFRGDWGEELSEALQEVGSPVVVNSKRPDRWESIPVDSFICNHKEALKIWKNESDNTLWQKIAPQLLTITMGIHGAETFWGCGQQKLWMASQVSGAARDVTGAGDAFTAGYAFQRLMNMRQELGDDAIYPGVAAMLHRGQAWAKACCSQIGCGTPVGMDDTHL